MNLFSKNFLLHLLLFLVIEVIFVFLIFREFLETDLLTAIGILHTSYWWVLLFAAWIREKCQRVWQKFLATYLPIVYHVGIHLIAGRMSVEEHMHEEHHDEHSLMRIIIASIAAGVLIFIGEYLLHRTTHCETHHADAHVHCHDGECEEKHE
jgi:lysylphosphatidylglycerol synthetase-like protein (DUF2156 family)